MPSIDLVALDQEKSWLSIDETNTGDDDTIQFLITSFSQYVLNRTGVSSFNTVQSYVENKDGNGNMRMFVNNPPIVSLTSLVIGGYNVPQSTSPTVSGIYVEDSAKSVAFRWSGSTLFPPYSIYPYCFTRGQGNVQITYQGGYNSVPYDLQEACMKAVAINYKRKDWIDLASKSLSAGAGVSGTTRYRDWALPPEIERVLSFYSRYARS